LLKERRFDAVYLLVNIPARHDDFAARATRVQRYIEQYWPNTRVVQRPIELVAVTDYREVYRVTNHAVQRIIADEQSHTPRFWVYLSPGTPQMQAVWVLLVQSGLLPARMLMATPPDLLAPTARAVREVDLSLPDFPVVVSPGEAARQLGVLEAQNDNLVAENRRLQAELELLRAGAPASQDGVIAGEFHLRQYLEAQERSFYVRALEQAGENAAEAARLLGVEPHTFRKRAVTLGVRQRRQRPGTWEARRGNSLA
jgi:hypothetical protein